MADVDLDRLNGWKEIAAYIDRTPRTAQRWEREYQFPVHRIEATGGEVVYAFRSEIDLWRKGGNVAGRRGSARAVDTAKPRGAWLSRTHAVAHKLDDAFGGHCRYIFAVAGLYGLLFA